MDEINFIHLLANPYRVKRNENKFQNNKNNEIFSFIKMKYPQYIVNDIYKDTIIQKLEKTLVETTIQSTIDDIIDTIECNSWKNTFVEI
tara:strand:- start:2326 stop:2592 length:267 start_codon:yes stop_codon:yes gene_type:complete